MAGEQVQAVSTTGWLQRLYAQCDPDGWLTLFSIDRASGVHHVDWAKVSQPEELARIALYRSATCCVWFGVATRHHQLNDGKRGGVGDCEQIPALWVDIDVAGPNHKTSLPLPPTIEAALNLIKSFPLLPTAVIRSGGGLQAYWLLTEPAANDQGTQTLLAAWGSTWAELGRRHGWHVDNVFDVARIMRLPGTTNRKTEPTPVTAKASWVATYQPDDFEPHLLDPPSPPEPTARLPYIGPERPGDAFNAVRTGSDVLLVAGFSPSRRTRNGEEHWTRPGKDRKDGSSATVYPDGHTTIWSDAVPGVEVNRPYDPFGLFCVLFHDGDFTAASEDLAAQGYGTSAKAADDLSWIPDASQPAQSPSTAQPDHAIERQERRLEQLIVEERLRRQARRAVDLEEQDADTDPPDDGPDPDIHTLLALPEPEYRWLIPGLLERGDRLILTGPEGGGKTTLLRQLAVTTAAGIHPFTLDAINPTRVLYVDLENSRRHTLRKMSELVIEAGPGLQAGQLIPINRPEGIDLLTRRDEHWLETRIEANKPDLLVIGPIYKLAGGDPTSEEVARHVAMVLDRLRTTHDIALAMEAHQPHGTNGGHRPDRPYGASLWMRWPEFGLAITRAGFLTHWRGPRDERDWPAVLARGGAWPWTTGDAKQATFAALMTACRQAGEVLSVRALSEATGITRTTVHRAIEANKAQWDLVRLELNSEDDD